MSVCQVQQWSSVWCGGHVGIGGAAGEDSAADLRPDDHRQPADWWAADSAGGGTSVYELVVKFHPH